MAQGQHGAPQLTLPGFWHYLLCEALLFCSADVYVKSYGTVFIPAWPDCYALFSISSAFTAASKHRNVSQALIPNTQDTDVASRGGGCPRWPGWCDVDTSVGLQLSLVPSGGAPGHLTAFLPTDKPCSLPRASSGWVIPLSKCVHGVQPHIFPTRVLLVIKGELQSYIAFLSMHLKSVSYTY